MRAAASAIVPLRSGRSGAAVDRLTMPDGGVLFVKSGQGTAARAIDDEAARLAWLAERVPTAPVRHVVREADASWLVTGAVPGVVAGAYLSCHPERVRDVAANLAAFLLELHALPATECPFDASVAGWLPVARARTRAGIVDEDDFDPEHASWPAHRVLAEVEALAGCARTGVVAHGDFTLGNVLVDARGQVTGCIDVGRLGTADLYQDIAILWRDLGGFGAHARKAMLDAMAIDPDPDRMRLHLALDELF